MDAIDEMVGVGRKKRRRNKRAPKRRNPNQSAVQCGPVRSNKKGHWEKEISEDVKTRYPEHFRVSPPTEFLRVCIWKRRKRVQPPAQPVESKSSRTSRDTTYSSAMAKLSSFCNGGKLGTGGTPFVRPLENSRLMPCFTASSTFGTVAFGVNLGVVPALYTPVSTRMEYQVLLERSLSSNSFVPRMSLSGVSPTK